MFFGLTNSPATFQTMMNNIFCDMIVEGVVCVYLNDILIFTKTLSEHWKITQRVLECLQEYNLCLKLEKCKFEHTRIEYLGVIILEGTVEMDPVKVSGVLEWPEPRNKREVQSFVGFVNFYRRFIKDFSHHTHALFDLTKKDVRWHWGKLEQASFNKLKELHLSLSSPMTPSPTTLKPIPPMQPPERSYPSRPHQRMVENGTQLPSSPRVSAQSNGTMRSTTRRC